EDKLPVFVAEQFPHIRVECCDTCKHYLRTVDLTKNGNAVAEADDLAAIPLTLWAQENGYTRIHTNLLAAEKLDRIFLSYFCKLLQHCVRNAQRSSRDVFFQMIHARRSRNRQHDW